MILRLLTYNVHSGVGMDHQLNLNRIADLIRATAPDLVALQEVDYATRRSGAVDQCSRYSELTGLHCQFGKAIDHEGGEYGQAILSRWPILDSQCYQLPTSPDTEARIVMTARVQPEITCPQLTLAATHFSYQPESDQPAQARKINELFTATSNDPLILAGDFNAEPDSVPITILKQHWRDISDQSFTFPSDHPKRKIDYIFVPHNSPFCLLNSQVITDSLASDHRPVLSQIEYSAATK